MTDMFSNKAVDRRSALVTLGSAGLGLLAMQWAPVYAVDFKSDSLGKLFPQFNDKSRDQILRLLKGPGFSGVQRTHPRVWSHLACRQRAQDR